MCGIIGYFRFRGEIDDTIRHAVIKGRDLLAHRGPDDAGLYLSPNKRCLLGHRRLSILDLSTAGHQPMTNEDETLWVVFNGEIYNYQKLYAELLDKGHRFRSHSDTEVILHLYEEVGTALVNQLDGMFAFVIYDAKLNRLFGARDRLGVKPLYYARTSHCFAFGSEPKALLVLPGISRDPRREEIPNYLAFNCIPGPQTLYRDINKLEPGTWFTLDSEGQFTQERFWLPGETEVATPHNQVSLVELLGKQLRAATHKRLMSDVPLGAMLSGGVDSSLVVALMSKSLQAPVRTFTVGYPGDDRDPNSDLTYARLIAQTFGTDHHEVILNEDQIVQILDDLPALADDPIGAPSVTVNLHLAQYARVGGVKVVQVGEGADEVFCGYSSVQRLWRLHAKLSVFRSLLSRRVAGWVVRKLNPLLRCFSNLSVIGSMDGTIAEQLGRYARGEHLYWGYGVLFPPAAQARLLGEGHPLPNPYSKLARLINTVPGFWDRDYLDQLAFIDLLLGLPERLLMRVDKATMLYSVEAREPFLDPGVIKVAFTAPPLQRAHHPKAFLKQYAQQLLPTPVLKRKKVGFPTAQHIFLAPKTLLRIQASILDKRFIDFIGFDPSEVNRFLKSVRDSRTRYFYHIWSLYILSLWFRYWVEGYHGG